MHVHGPVGLCMLSLREFGADIDENFVVKMQGEMDLDILNVPFQTLQLEISQRATSERARKAAIENPKRKWTLELDRRVDKGAKKNIQK